MKCDNCGKEGARAQKVSRTYGKEKDLILIENIPVIDCPNCGQSYMTADTLHEIQRIKLHRRSFTHKRTVRSAEFSI